MAEQVIGRIALYDSGVTPKEDSQPNPLYVHPDPVAGASGDARWPVKIGDSPQVGGWQYCDLIKDGDVFYVEFQDSKRTLSFTSQGMQTRGKGWRGAWEQLRAVQEPTQNGNRHFLYRFTSGGRLLYVIEYREV